MKNQNLVLPLAALMLAASAAGGVVSLAHADTRESTATATVSQMREKPAAMGTVTAVSGSTITLNDERAGTTYTVDASTAAITKHEKLTTAGEKPAETTISVTDIAVGDMLMVRGSVSGSSIVATAIEDGRGFGRAGFVHGMPGIHGTVSAVNGTTLTVTDADGKTFTVDGTSATAMKMVTIGVSDIAVGSSVGVEGTVSGSSVAATRIMDGLPKGPAK